MEYETGAHTLLLLVMLKRKMRNPSNTMMGHEKKKKKTQSRVVSKTKHLTRLNIRNSTISEMSE